MALAKDSKILIVGAGVFGLSTALHLAARGYTNVHIFDSAPYDRSHYAFAAGAVAASADENKILRASYGDRRLYQDLAFAAMPAWQAWNEHLASTPEYELPDCLRSREKVWFNCGYARLNSMHCGLDESERDTQRNFPPELRETQYRISSEADRARAVADGVYASKLDPLGRLHRGQDVDGVLDTTAGFVLAANACTLCLHLCRQAGVHIHLGGAENTLERLTRVKDRVTGFTAASGVQHEGDLVVIATGGWTPSLLSEADRLLETTAGSVIAFQLGEHDRVKFAPDRFPVFDWNMSFEVPEDERAWDGRGRETGGLYALPCTPEGVFKIAFRGAKWTDYTAQRADDGSPLSFPCVKGDEIPETSMKILHEFCRENLPELVDLTPLYVRLCWYTDSVDDGFLIDHVPGTTGLVVASGGSGHGFKFLPVLGRHVVDVIERHDTDYTRLFAWKSLPSGPRNGLEEGPQGWRTLRKQRMVRKDEWARLTQQLGRRSRL